RETMGLNKLIERLYLKVFVGIATSYTGTDVVVEMIKGGDVKERIANRFEAGEEAKIADFLAPYLAESPFHYVAYLNAANDQGALPVHNDKEAKTFIDTSTTLTLSQKNKWLVYSSKLALDELKKSFKDVGVDFIFSPFSVLNRFFTDKIDTGTALYVLAEEDVISAAVFAEGQLLYGRRLALPEEQDIGLEESEGGDSISLSFELDVDGIEEGLELDDINAIDDLEGLDDLHEIEDLDTLDDLDTFSEEVAEVSEISLPEEEPEAVADEPMKSFDKDYKRFQLIQTALQHYYSEPKFDSRFVESVYIADGCGVSDDLKQYLEEELFVKVYVRRIDIPTEIVDLAKMEAADA
ncbi:MAG: hypothetical protein R3302_01615, partial [Sulfurimonadaceae bacterium]|nr:hypothetical protein [Sulfurimonadaceae bacterium]